MALLTDVFAQGTHAARPAADAAHRGYYYFETDTQTLFQSTGSVWVQLAAAVGGGGGGSGISIGDLITAATGGQVLQTDNTGHLVERDALPLAVQIDRHWGDFTVMAPGALVTFPCDLTDKHQVTLTGSTTLALSGPHVGQTILLRLVQDGSGGHAVTWPGGITWFTSDFSPPTIAAAAAAVTLVSFLCTGAGAFDGFWLGNSSA